MVTSAISTEQAQEWCLDLLGQCRAARIDANNAHTPDAQRKSFRVLLVRYGSTVGVIDALWRVGLLTDSFRDQTKNDALISIAERVVDAPG